jgi:hypothetical protein
VDGGDTYATSKLAELLADRGAIENLTARADAGDTYAATQLAKLLGNRGDLDTLTTRADAVTRTLPGSSPGCSPTAAISATPAVGRLERRAMRHTVRNRSIPN